MRCLVGVSFVDYLFFNFIFLDVLLFFLFHFSLIQSLYLQINVAVQCLSTDFSSQKGVKVIFLRLFYFLFIFVCFCVRAQTFRLFHSAVSRYAWWSPMWCDQFLECWLLFKLSCGWLWSIYKPIRLIHFAPKMSKSILELWIYWIF